LSGSPLCFGSAASLGRREPSSKETGAAQPILHTSSFVRSRLLSPSVRLAHVADVPMGDELSDPTKRDSKKAVPRWIAEWRAKLPRSPQLDELRAVLAQRSTNPADVVPIAPRNAAPLRRWWHAMKLTFTALLTLPQALSGPVITHPSPTKVEDTGRSTRFIVPLGAELTSWQAAQFAAACGTDATGVSLQQSLLRRALEGGPIGVEVRICLESPEDAIQVSQKIRQLMTRASEFFDRLEFRTDGVNIIVDAVTRAEEPIKALFYFFQMLVTTLAVALGLLRSRAKVSVSIDGKALPLPERGRRSPWSEAVRDPIESLELLLSRLEIIATWVASRLR